MVNLSCIRRCRTSKTSKEARRNVLLCSHPRVASNLFMRLFQAHPDIQTIEYSFMNAFYFGPEKLSAMNLVTGNAEEDEKLRAGNKSETYQSAYDRLQSSIASVNSTGKAVIIKEHVMMIADPPTLMAHSTTSLKQGSQSIPHIVDRSSNTLASSSNPTILPDAFIESVNPIILFRHPALLIPSYYRLCCNEVPGYSIHDDGDLAVWASLRWLVYLFDWLKVSDRGVAKKIKKGKQAERRFPLVVEADDFVHEPHVIPAICKAAGIDSAHVQYQWNREERPMKTGDFIHNHNSTLMNSTGVVKRKEGKPRDCDIDLADAKTGWQQEFGDDVAGVIARYVELAMPDYWYLRRWRF